MLQRPFGQRSGLSIPRANIGGMRLPKDDDQAVALIRHAIDSGMKYIDTSRGYGDSEIKLGKALKDGYREKVILSTKWSPWIVKIEPTDDTSADSMRRRIEESMKRLDVDYLDYFQIWNIDSREHYQQATAKGGMLDGIRKAIDEGLVRHTGFTTHDSVDNILSYIAEADWCEIILFTYNLLNTQYARAIKAAHDKGIGTIIMNPVGGGRLASQDSPALAGLAGQLGVASVADMAIRWLMSHDYIDTVICGINKPSDIDATIASTNAGPLTPAQMQQIETLLTSVSQQRQKYCTWCRYCMPCPQEIDIPNVMNMIFDEKSWGLLQDVKQRDSWMKVKADVCARCGECEGKCPQKLEIMDAMEYANKAYAK